MGRTILKEINEVMEFIFNDRIDGAPAWMVVLLGLGGFVLWVALNLRAYLPVSAILLSGTSTDPDDVVMVFVAQVMINTLLTVVLMAFGALTLNMLFKPSDSAKGTYQDEGVVQPEEVRPEEVERTGRTGIMALLLPPTSETGVAASLVFSIGTFIIVVILAPIVDAGVFGLSVDSPSQPWRPFIVSVLVPALACVPVVWVCRYFNPPVEDEESGVEETQV